MAAPVFPVFLKSKDIPNASADHPVTVLEMCLAAEKTAGPGSVVGAQLIGGLWRLYPTTKEARSSILMKGLHLRGSVMQVQNSNPFII